MSDHTPAPSAPPHRWWTPLRRTVGIWLLPVALLLIPIIGIAADSGFRIDSGKYKVFTYWAAVVMILDLLTLIAWATLDGKRPLLAALPVLLFIGTILAAPLVMILF